MSATCLAYQKSYMHVKLHGARYNSFDVGTYGILSLGMRNVSYYTENQPLPFIRTHESTCRYFNKLRMRRRKLVICDRILDFSTSAQEDARFVKLFGRYLGLYY